MRLRITQNAVLSCDMRQNNRSRHSSIIAKRASDLYPSRARLESVDYLQMTSDAGVVVIRRFVYRFEDFD